MAEYKVPQDVEADDKLLGPFTFRQFIYLIVCAGLITVAWGLANIFIPLVIIPIPFLVFFGALALPLRKDQPMETYLTALISFYFKPHVRLWVPGLPEHTITIEVPKKDENDNRATTITAEEASHRLSYLSNLIDESGRIINSSTFQTDAFAEAINTQDIFEQAATNSTLNQAIDEATYTRHQELVSNTATMIRQADSPPAYPKPPVSTADYLSKSDSPLPISGLPVIQPLSMSPSRSVTTPPTSGTSALTPQPPISSAQPSAEESVSPELKNLSEQDDLSVETIAKEAKRLKEKHEKEVFISLRGDKK